MEHPPPTYIINVREFAKDANKHSHFVTPYSIIVNMPELKAVEDRIVKLFVYKRLNKIVKSSKDYIKILANLVVNIRQTVKGRIFPRWEILLPTTKDCIALTRRYLQNQDSILRVEYSGQHRMKMRVFEIPSFVSGQQVDAFLMKYGELVKNHLDKNLVEWKYKP